ncbi:MAG: hypothetical protein JOZ78_09935 [Chroococcidiopsidaceae cyanobacterium CP_BM_ER_R8_30]|nr:hypothetical protein [Chroococcidiopsidaceae cyanobacterium CP_BM_ER_R8_30]
MNQYIRLKDAVGIGGLGATLLVLSHGLPAKAQPTSTPPVGAYESGYRIRSYKIY